MLKGCSGSVRDRTRGLQWRSKPKTMRRSAIARPPPLLAGTVRSIGSVGQDSIQPRASLPYSANAKTGGGSSVQKKSQSRCHDATAGALWSLKTEFHTQSGRATLVDFMIPGIGAISCAFLSVSTVPWVNRLDDGRRPIAQTHHEFVAKINSTFGTNLTVADCKSLRYQRSIQTVIPGSRPAVSPWGSRRKRSVLRS